MDIKIEKCERCHIVYESDWIDLNRIYHEDKYERVCPFCKQELRDEAYGKPLGYFTPSNSTDQDKYYRASFSKLAEWKNWVKKGRPNE